MMKIVPVVIFMIMFAVTAFGQTDVVVTPSHGFALDYDGAGVTVMTMSATPGTVVTTLTVLVQSAYCSNTTGGAVSVNLTDTAGTSLATAFSIGANSAPTALINTLAGIKMVGIKMWASAINSINCVIRGKI